jgi:hypothetical protein
MTETVEQRSYQRAVSAFRKWSGALRILLTPLPPKQAPGG